MPALLGTATKHLKKESNRRQVLFLGNHFIVQPLSIAKVVIQDNLKLAYLKDSYAAAHSVYSDIF